MEHTTVLRSIRTKRFRYLLLASLDVVKAVGLVRRFDRHLRAIAVGPHESAGVINRRWEGGNLSLRDERLEHGHLERGQTTVSVLQPSILRRAGIRRLNATG